MADSLYQNELFQRGMLNCTKLGYFPLEESISELKLKSNVLPTQKYQYQLYLHLFRACTLKQDKKLNTLELYCGSGGGLKVLDELFPNNNHFVGLDSNKSAIELARVNSEVDFYCYENEVLNFADNSFDVVFCIEPESSSIPVKEIQRILKKDGTFGIAGLNLDDTITGFEVTSDKDISFQVAMAAKKSTPMLIKATEAYVPLNMRREMQTRWLCKSTKYYEALRLGTLQYSCKTYVKGSSNIEGKQPVYANEAGDHVDSNDTLNFFDYRDVYPEMVCLQTQLSVIKNEMEMAMTKPWPLWPEESYQSPGSEWRVLPLCYTFPADDASKTVWVKATSTLCPKTVQLLKSIPGVRTALFSKLGPDTNLGAHRGWADLSNHILRCHLGIDVPSNCAIVVNNETRFQENGGLLMFDDSKLHSAYNHSDQTRTILIIDVFRPLYMPRGTAVGSHTIELDKFIASFGL